MRFCTVSSQGFKSGLVSVAMLSWINGMSVYMPGGCKKQEPWLRSPRVRCAAAVLGCAVAFVPSSGCSETSLSISHELYLVAHGT